MRKTKTWNDHLNDLVRDVIFPDEELKTLMMIPEAKWRDIITFTTKYFCKDAASDELVTDEPVRICYYQSAGRSIGMQMLKKRLDFDIYVKDTELHNTGTDMLRCRDELIAEKLKQLLTDDKYVCQVDFHFEDEYHLYTKLAGYHRYHIHFTYKTSF